MSSSRASPCVWHPGRAGTKAMYPSVSSSMITTSNSDIFPLCSELVVVDIKLLMFGVFWFLWGDSFVCVQLF